MQDKNIQTNTQEDEIDLRELFKTIWNRKIFIIIFTSIVTGLAIAYVLTRIPIYEAKGLIEIGTYKNGLDKKLVDNTANLTQKLNILYIDIFKNEKNRESWIENISILKNQKDFLSISSHAHSTQQAVIEVNNIVKYIQTEHKKILVEIIDNKKLILANVDRKINILKNNILVSINEDIKYLKTNSLVNIEEDIKYIHIVQVPSLKQKIETVNQKIKNAKKQLKLVNINIAKKSKDSSLIALNVIEKRSLESELSSLKLRVIDLENHKRTLESKTLPRLLRSKDELMNTKLQRLLRKKDTILNIDLTRLLEEKNLVEQSLLSHNYKNSSIVGNIMTNDYPIKPKKKLIVLVSFVTGLILSIFLVFFLEFIKNGKKEDNEKKIKSSN